MCAKNNHESQNKTKAAAATTRRRRKRPRPKTKKLKYLINLQLEFSNQNKIQTPKQPTKKTTKTLFPLHPENIVQDHHKDLHDDINHVAFLFETATDDTSTTLQGLLDSTAASTSEEEKVPQMSSSSLSYRYHDQLVRSALRSKQRDASEDRWVSFSEVVLEKRIISEQEDVISSCSSGSGGGGGGGVVDSVTMRQFHDQESPKRSLVGLKLDYQEILNAWSDKGPLYTASAVDDINLPPQTVPELNDPTINALIDGWENNNNTWTVPEIKDNILKEKEEETKDGHKLAQREASVLRYKEKRQSRLFSKRIRYEVRKLNAEKRPRVKGRFVKRDEED